MKQFLAIAIIVLLSSFRPTIETTITGHLRSKTGKTNLKALPVIIKKKHVTLATTQTDNSGNFVVTLNLGLTDLQPLYIYYINKQDTVLLKRLVHFESDTPEYTFYIR